MAGSGQVCEIAENCMGEVQQICRDGFCSCFAGLGFTGINCDQPSGHSRYNQTANLTQTIVSSLLFVYCVFLLYRLRSLHTATKIIAGLNDKSSERYKKLYIVLGFALLSSLFFFTYTLFQTILAFNPQVGEPLTLKDGNKFFTVIVPPGGSFAQFTLASAFLFVVSASISIALSLIEVAESFNQMTENTKFISFVTFFKKFSFVFLAILYLLKLSLTLADQVRVTQIIAVFILFLLGALFLFGRVSFVNIIKEMATASKFQSSKAISLVTKTSTVHSIFNTMMAIIATTEFILFPTGGDIKPGEFNHLVFLTDLFIFSALCLVACDLWYTTMLLKNMELNHTSSNQKKSVKQYNTREESTV